MSVALIKSEHHPFLLPSWIKRNWQFAVIWFGTEAALLKECKGMQAVTSKRIEKVIAELDAIKPGKAIGKAKLPSLRGMTNLHGGISALKRMNPKPDNMILLVDGLPTRGASEPRGRTVGGKQRLRLYNRAIGELRSGIPVNVILFPMEGDFDAPISFWSLALTTRGSFMTVSRDWP